MDLLDSSDLRSSTASYPGHAARLRSDHAGAGLARHPAGLGADRGAGHVQPTIGGPPRQTSASNLWQPGP